MRNFFPIIIIVFTVNLQAQWSTDPNNNLIVGYGLDPHICSDSAGGCYISYDFDNIYYPRKLALERLDKYGYKPWGINKQILGELPEQSHAEIIEDGEGGVIVSYEDRFEDLPITAQRVRVQRVDSSGNFLWGTTGVNVTLEEINHGKQQLVTDGSGGCVVIWKTTTRVFYINRISASGERLWSDSGKVLGISSYSGTEPKVVRAADGSFYAETGEYIYRIRENGEIVRRDSVAFEYIVPDNKGGIVLSGRANWSINGFTLVAQRKDSLGNNLWQEPYVEIADSLDINTHLEIKYNNGFIYYSWSGKKNGIDKVVQFQALGLDGAKLFPIGSIQVGKPPLGGAYVVPLEKNKTTFIYHETNYLPDSLLAQPYDTLGNKLWDTSGVLISHPSIEYQSFTADGNGGFIIGGVIDNFKIVAQQVNKYGYLGEIITDLDAEKIKNIPTDINLFQNFPNPFNPSTVIEFSLPEDVSNVKLSIYNALGEKVAEIVNTSLVAGKYQYQWNAQNVATGMYIYELRTDKFISIKKMILLK